MEIAREKSSLLALLVPIQIDFAYIADLSAIEGSLLLLWQVSN